MLAPQPDREPRCADRHHGDDLEHRARPGRHQRRIHRSTFLLRQRDKQEADQAKIVLQFQCAPPSPTATDVNAADRERRARRRSEPAIDAILRLPKLAMFCFRSVMDDSPTPPPPPITPERIEALRERLRQNPISYRSRYGYPPNPGLSWIDRLP